MMGTNETVKCVGSDTSQLPVQYFCIRVRETLSHVTLKRQAEISADIYALLFRYFGSSLQEFDIIFLPFD